MAQIFFMAEIVNKEKETSETNTYNWACRTTCQNLPQVFFGNPMNVVRSKIHHKLKNLFTAERMNLLFCNFIYKKGDGGPVMCSFILF